MSLFGEVNRFANDLVIPWGYLSNDPLPLGLGQMKRDPIAYGYGVGIFYFLKAKSSFETTLIKLLVFSLDQIPASCGFVYDSFHASLLAIHLKCKDTKKAISEILIAF